MEGWLISNSPEEPFPEEPQLCRATGNGTTFLPKPALDVKKILAQGESWPYLTLPCYSSEARPLQEALELPGWRRHGGMGWTLQITTDHLCPLYPLISACGLLGVGMAREQRGVN